uniref:Response regulator with CheY-like receiver, AAA-type ATPase, and DNA-binding domains n=1 Tax=Desulfovibrio sp. U5L TaxID=596152 RepID=I2Q745_9BACT
MPTPAPGLMEALGQSDAFLAFMERVAAAARVDRPALLVGERGTGKELAATRLHFHSPRWERPFVTVNLAALPRTLLEAELFGHEAGAFTGAARRRPGRFEAADGGTLFLDELQAAPREVQEKLLRVLEYGTFERLGASDTLHVDVRVVAAVNVDPRELIRRGRLLPDLLDRLAFAVLPVPPLRHRHGDIRYLAERFAARFAAELGRDLPPAFAPAALDLLLAHPWPGNIRELKNVVERAVFETPGPQITHVTLDPFDHPFAPSSTPPAITPAPPLSGGPGGMIPPGGEVQERQSLSWPPEASSSSSSPSLPSWYQATAAFETDLLGRALARTGGNQRRAAEVLGLTYHQFRGLYRKYAPALALRPGYP